MSDTIRDHDHHGPDCPECRAASEACKILGGFAEAMEKMLADGTFRRLGERMAMEHERAIMDIICPPDGK